MQSSLSLLLLKETWSVCARVRLYVYVCARICVCERSVLLWLHKLILGEQGREEHSNKLWIILPESTWRLCLFFIISQRQRASGRRASYTHASPCWPVIPLSLRSNFVFAFFFFFLEVMDDTASSSCRWNNRLCLGISAHNLFIYCVSLRIAAVITNRTVITGTEKQQQARRGQ